MKPRVYRKKPGFGLILSGILRILIILAIAAVVLFFLLRSWTVYDDQGAHIQFPWSQTAEE